jgi:hypothetical protein
MIVMKTILKTTYTLSLITSLIVMIECSSERRPTPVEFNAELYNPPYNLITPEGWGVERLGIPIDFAPTIPYSGVEDIRFAPGWADSASDEYWTYAFLWYLDGKPEINSESIEKNLNAYYTGLIGRNIDKRNIPQEKISDVKVSMKQINTSEGDLQTYSGTIDMLDYMGQKPITLNCIVHIKSCGDENHTFVFYEISPKPLTSDVWKEMDKLWVACSKTSAK